MPPKSNAQRVQVEPGNAIIGKLIAIPAAGSQPIQLSDQPESTISILLQAPSGNSDAIQIFNTAKTDTVYELAAGSQIAIDIASPSLVWVAGTEDDTVRWLGLTR